MKKATLVRAMLMATVVSPSAIAQSIEEKSVANGKFKFDPESGYIFLSGTNQQIGLFLKAPSQLDIEEYTVEWESQFAKAKEKYAKKLKSWEQAAKTSAQTKSKPPEKPVEPTRENFSTGSIETRNAISFGPDFAFSKNKEKPEYTYMVKVKPGIYTYHGPIYFNSQVGYTGTCYCMGSVQLEVKAGLITDLGNFLSAAPSTDISFGFDTRPMVMRPNAFSSKIDINIKTSAVKFGLPELLKAYPSVVGDFRAAGKSENYFGAMISRMPPIPGVLGYQRDKVVDLKASSPQSNSTQ